MAKKQKVTKIVLGKTYKDNITGFVGVATAVAKYLTGCTQATLEGEFSKDKNEIPSWWFDISRLELVKAKKKKKINKKDEPAGPQRVGRSINTRSI